MTHESAYDSLGQGGRKEGLPQYVSKNVGMRRACGRWSLVTNADCMISADLLRFIELVVSLPGAGREREREGEGDTDTDWERDRERGSTVSSTFYLAGRLDLQAVPAPGPPFSDGGFPFGDVMLPHGDVIAGLSHVDTYPLAQVSLSLTPDAHTQITFVEDSLSHTHTHLTTPTLNSESSALAQVISERVCDARPIAGNVYRGTR